jgi:hypothetical protein
MGAKITGAGGVEVETNAAGQLHITAETNVATNPGNVGAIRVFSENDPGAVTGEAYLKSPETSTDYRLRVGTDSVWDSEQFNYVAQNTTKHKYTSTTLTMTWAGGTLNTNGGSVTTTGAACQIQTYRHFPLLGAGAVYFETTMCLSVAMSTNINIDFGGMTLAAAGTSVPTDGVYFRINSSGILGVLNSNGTETTSAAFTFTQSVNVFNKFTITSTQSEVEFWIDDVLMAHIDRGTGVSQPHYAASVPFAIRHHHTGVAGAIVQAKFGGYSVTLGDMDTQRMWSSTMAGQGHSSIQGASGHTQGQTANNVNSTVPATASLSNTAAGYATLGGRFLFAAPAGAETDYALFAYLNPVPTTGITGRNLVIRGVWIETFNAVVAVATTPTVLEWSLGVGSTAVSLATADAAATRAPRRIGLGSQSFLVGALAGANSERCDVNLDAPVVVEPGTYMHIILRVPYGTATATELFRGMVGINGYWE